VSAHDARSWPTWPATSPTCGCGRWGRSVETSPLRTRTAIWPPSSSPSMPASASGHDAERASCRSRSSSARPTRRRARTMRSSPPFGSAHGRRARWRPTSSSASTSAPLSGSLLPCCPLPPPPRPPSGSRWAVWGPDRSACTPSKPRQWGRRLATWRRMPRSWPPRPRTKSRRSTIVTARPSTNASSPACSYAGPFRWRPPAQPETQCPHGGLMRSW